MLQGLAFMGGGHGVSYFHDKSKVGDARSVVSRAL